MTAKSVVRSAEKNHSTGWRFFHRFFWNIVLTFAIGVFLLFNRFDHRPPISGEYEIYFFFAIKLPGILAFCSVSATAHILCSLQIRQPYSFIRGIIFITLSALGTLYCYGFIAASKFIPHIMHPGQILGVCERVFVRASVHSILHWILIYMILCRKLALKTLLKLAICDCVTLAGSYGLLEITDVLVNVPRPVISTVYVMSFLIWTHGFATAWWVLDSDNRMRIRENKSASHLDEGLGERDDLRL